VVFYLTNLPPNLEKLARSEGSVRMTDEAVAHWIIDNGHGGSTIGRYGQWLGVVPGWQNVDEKGVARGRCFEAGTDPAAAPRYCGVLQGNWGYSTFFRGPVLELRWSKSWPRPAC
jgi:peptide/nickel transport system permease protein